MNPFTVIALVASLSFASAQIGGTSTGSQSGFGDLGGGILGGGGPLSLLSNQPTATSLSTANPTASTGITNTNLGATNNNLGATNTNLGATNTNINPMLSNPFLSYGLMGGENLMRAIMAPYFSRFGNTAGLYYLRGGPETFSKVLMTDVINRALASSTGMNPLMSAFFSSQLTDAPENYPVSNMIMNSGMFGLQQGAGAGGMMNNGSPNSIWGGNQFNPMFLYPFIGM